MSATKEKSKISLTEARISFAFPQDMKDQLNKLAESQGRSLSNFIRLTLLDRIKKEGKPHTKIKLNGTRQAS